MKKQKIRTLNLSKNLISNLGNLDVVRGGLDDGNTFNCGNSLQECFTHHPNCLQPSDISACLLCMEEFTEGCDTTVTFC
ncbi:hypothetical protein [Kordia sp.]|uniref:hypothetical protein n=1 Tax=Kordia sp. TaxID=1965332 RepID=UPI003D6B5835